MKASEVPVGEWFMTREKKWFKKANDGEIVVIATKIGDPKIYTIDNNEEVQIRK